MANRLHLILLGACLLAMVGLQWASLQTRSVNGMLPAGSPVPAPMDGDIVLGRADAPKTMLAFVSLTCVHCQHWEREVLPALKRDLVSSGQVRLVLRDFPLDGAALDAAALLRCLSPETREAAHAWLMAHMTEWEQSRENLARLPLVDASISKDAMACALRPQVREAVMSAVQGASRDYGVQATPFFVLGGRRVTGELDEAGVEALLGAGSSGGGR